MSKYLIIYHANCQDGFCAAWLAQSFLSLGDKIDFIEANYGDPIPSVELLSDRNVFILDFSYPKEQLLQIAAEAKAVVVLDHHKTALEKLGDLVGNKSGNLDVRFDMNESGASMAFDYFYGKTSKYLSYRDEKLLVDYVKDRDLWQWKLPKSREVSAALASYPKTLEAWDQLDVEKLMVEGEAILRYQKQSVASAVKNTRVATLSVGDEQYKIPCLNATGLISEIGEELNQSNDLNEKNFNLVFPLFSMTYFVRQNGSLVFSLRSTKEFGVDVSAIAKHFDGGGHAQAAGFTVTSYAFGENSIIFHQPVAGLVRFQ